MVIKTTAKRKCRTRSSKLYKRRCTNYSRSVSYTHLDVYKRQKEDGGENKDEKNSEQEKALLQQLGSYELKDQHDKIIKLEDYKGKVVFLNFWATWCPPCRGELPNIQKLYEKYRSDKHVAILTIVYPGGQEKGKSDLKEFLSLIHI